MRRDQTWTKIQSWGDNIESQFYINLLRKMCNNTLVVDAKNGLCRGVKFTIFLCRPEDIMRGIFAQLFPVPDDTFCLLLYISPALLAAKRMLKCDLFEAISPISLLLSFYFQMPNYISCQRRREDDDGWRRKRLTQVRRLKTQKD